MAHFRGWIKGSRGTAASRLGTKDGGIEANVASWQGAVHVNMHHTDGRDYVNITLCQHTNGQGANPPVLLYDGPVAGGRHRCSDCGKFDDRPGRGLPRMPLLV